MIYDRIGRLVYKSKCAYSAVLTNEEFEDIVSECVLEYMRLVRDRGEQLSTLVHNNVVDHLRHRSVIMFVGLEDSPEPAVSSSNMTEVMCDISNYLDKDEVHIVSMRMAGYTYREIAEDTQQNISRKMQSIKDKLSKYRETIRRVS